MAQTWAFVAAGTSVTGSNPTVGLPTGWATGNLLVVLSAAGNAFTQVTPTGWTQIILNGTNQHISAWWKFAGSGETALALNNGSATNGSAVMIAYSGISALDVLGTEAVGSGTTVTTNSLTTTVADDLVISLYTCSTTAAATWTAPASTTTRVNIASTTSFFGLLIVDEDKATAGATTARTATLSTSITTDSIAISFKQTISTATGNFFFLF
jgi:hypothetical protein